VCGARKSCFVSQLVPPGTNRQFWGLALAAPGLLGPEKPVAKANQQRVLLGLQRSPSFLF
jgi:hypothetical protein